MRSVGYRQAWDFINGDYDRAELLEKGVAATRQLAKRQFTWLRKWPSIQKVIVDYEVNSPDCDAINATLRKIKPLITELGI